MQIAILCDEDQKKDILGKNTLPDVDIFWPDSLSSLLMIEADAYFDLKFEWDPERISRLERIAGKPLFIGSVPYTKIELGLDACRINDWPTLLGKESFEIAGPAAPAASLVLDQIGWAHIIVPDICGLISPTVISMIINEAWFSFEAGISSMGEIDKAMRLGTGYPFGPFEWFERIGKHRVAGLLIALRRKDKRYEISASLLKAAGIDIHY